MLGQDGDDQKQQLFVDNPDRSSYLGISDNQDELKQGEGGADASRDNAASRLSAPNSDPHSPSGPAQPDTRSRPPAVQFTAAQLQHANHLVFMSTYTLLTTTSPSSIESGLAPIDAGLPTPQTTAPDFDPESFTEQPVCYDYRAYVGTSSCRSLLRSAFILGILTLMGVQYYVSYVSTHTHINELGELWSDRPLSDIVVVGFKQPCPQDTFDLGPFASAAYGSNDVTLLSGWKRIKICGATYSTYPLYYKRNHEPCGPNEKPCGSAGCFPAMLPCPITGLSIHKGDLPDAPTVHKFVHVVQGVPQPYTVIDHRNETGRGSLIRFGVNVHSSLPETNTDASSQDTLSNSGHTKRSTASDSSMVQHMLQGTYYTFCLGMIRGSQFTTPCQYPDYRYLPIDSYVNISRSFYQYYVDIDATSEVLVPAFDSSLQVSLFQLNEPLWSDAHCPVSHKQMGIWLVEYSHTFEVLLACVTFLVVINILTWACTRRNIGLTKLYSTILYTMLVAIGAGIAVLAYAGIILTYGKMMIKAYEAGDACTDLSTRVTLLNRGSLIITLMSLIIACVSLALAPVVFLIVTNIYYACQHKQRGGFGV